MAYAEYSDVEIRLKRTFSDSEKKLCDELLNDSAVIIDTYNKNASEDVIKKVSNMIETRYTPALKRIETKLNDLLI